MEKPVLFTIGHSTHGIEDFIGMLEAYGIEEVADVRTMPMSRYAPQFNRDALAQSLAAAGIRYMHLEKLGGLRHAKKDSINLGWRNASFRGYADYMQTDGFSEGLAELMQAAREKLTAIMCAEAVPWRCHRSMISDALIANGWSVRDIMSRTSAPARAMTPFAKVADGRITYPAPAPDDAAPGKER